MWLPEGTPHNWMVWLTVGPRKGDTEIDAEFEEKLPADSNAADLGTADAMDEATHLKDAEG